MKLDIDPKTQREEWLEGRRAGLGSSDVPAILLPADKRPKYMAPWKVFRSKVEGIEEEVTSLFMEFGNRFERAVGQHVADKQEMVLVDGGWYRHDEKGWMMASPDFWLEPHPHCSCDGPPEFLSGRRKHLADCRLFDTRQEGVECKVVQNQVNAADWLTHSAPPHVTIQAHWCMAVTGAKRWHIGALLWFAQDFRHYVIEHDQAFQDKLTSRAWAWWDRHIIHKNQPPIDATDACGEALLDRHRYHDDITRDANDVESQIIKEWRGWSAAYKHAEAEKKRCENVLKLIISGNRAISSRVEGRVTWAKCKGREALDQKALKNAHPDIHAQFVKRGAQYRRMTYAKPKN